MTDYSTYTDKELIFLLKEGEESAFTEIYRRHWHMLYLHAWKILDDKDEAKDLVQDMFFSFWENVEVVYADDLPSDIESNGYLSRETKLSVVLKAIEKSGQVHFRVENRKIYVSK